MSKPKMTRAFKRRALRQWASAFPEVAIVNSIQAGRLVGPFYQGIALDRDSSNDGYFPTAHVHNLADPMNVLTLGMKTRLNDGRVGIDYKVTVDRHEREFHIILERFKTQMPLPMEGDISLAQFLDAYERFIHEQHYDRLDWAVMLDLLTAEVWIGDPDRIRMCQRRCDFGIDKLWPEGPKNEHDVKSLKTYLAFRNATRSELEVRVAESIERLKLEKLVRRELVP